jgi:hypothetical protein
VTAANSPLLAVEHAARLAEDIHFFGQAQGDIERARQCYDKLRGLASDHPSCPDVRRRVVNGALRLTACHAVRDEVDAITLIQQYLERLAADWPDDVMVRRGRCELAVTLSVKCARTGDADGSERAYESIVALATAHPQDECLPVTLAKAMANLVVLRHEAGRTAEAEEVHDQLRLLSLACRSRPDVSLYRAQGSLNLIICLASIASADRGLAVLDDLATHVASGDIGEAGHELLADAAFTLATELCARGDFDGAHGAYDRLCAYADCWREVEAFSIGQASAAFNMMTDYCETRSFERAHRLYDDILALSVACQGETEIATICAKAGLNIALTCASNGRPDIAALLTDDLTALLTANPECQEIREIVSRAG